MTKSTPSTKDTNTSKTTPVSSPHVAKFKFHHPAKVDWDRLRRGPPNTSTTNRVFTIGLSPSIMIAYCLKSSTQYNPKRGKHAAYVWPAIKFFNNATEEEKEQLEIAEVVSRRANSTSNESIPSEPGSVYPAKQFVSFVTNPNDNTIKKRRSWGKKLAKWLDELAQTDAYRYKCNFQYCGDKTKDTLLPANHYLHDKDIVLLVQDMFSHVSQEELAQDEELVSQFFGEENVDHGRNVFQAAAAIIREMEEDATDSSDDEWWR